jgi:hypothetical protein
MTSAIESGFWQRVRAGLRRPAFGLITLMALLASTQILFQPHLFEMWELPDIAQEWVNYLGEIMAIGVLMWISVVAAEECRPRSTIARIALLTAAIIAPALLAVWLISWYYSGQWWPTAPQTVFAETLKYSMFGALVYGARALQRHAERANQQALAVDATRRELEREAAEAQLQLLQAQLEPHFLFNTLANVRRLYRKQPAAGAETIDNLMTYLRARCRRCGAPNPRWLKSSIWQVPTCNCSRSAWGRACALSWTCPPVCAARPSHR